MKARMRRLAGGTILLALGIAAAHAQAVNDPDVDIHVIRPAFPQNGGPVVAVDAAHNNYHTTEDRYAPFAALLRNDGFRVLDSKAAFTRDMLLPVGVLVIAMPYRPFRRRTGTRRRLRLSLLTRLPPSRRGSWAAARCC